MTSVKDILAYRAREVMTARQFVEFWLADDPDAEPHEIARLLADVVQENAHCIHIPNGNPELDVWNETQYLARRDLQNGAVATLRAMSAEGRGIEGVPSVSLSRDSLVKTFDALKIPGPSFLYPPDPMRPLRHARDRGTLSAPAPPPGVCETVAGECRHSDDYRTVFWFGQNYTFTATQARAVELLWREFVKGDLGLSQATVGEDLDSANRNFRLRDLFRVSGASSGMHPAWDTMIQSVGKGIYALRTPVSSTDCE